MNKFSKLAFIAATTVMAASVSAQTVVQQPTASAVVPVSKQPINDNWASGNGDTVWLNGSGERCVRSGNWTPGTANRGCDGALVEVAQPARPAPVVAPHSDEKVTYQKEIQFDFDKTILKPNGKAQLDAIVEEIKNLDSLEVVVVNGYTDFIGADVYNMDLSRRRTEPVKAYLVSKGIDESKVYTEGKGKSEPVVADCKQKIATITAKTKKAKTRLQRSELLKCLAPNRRVKIDAIGTGRQG